MDNDIDRQGVKDCAIALSSTEPDGTTIIAAMEAPAVTASSPISGGSSHHRHSSSASPMDDEDGVNSKLVIDLEAYAERRGSYSPSEYYCYSVCDATSAAEAMQAGKACEGGGKASSPSSSTIATTSCLGNGHGATMASLSESIESVVSAAAAFASSPSTGSAGGGNVLVNNESEDGPTTGAHRRPIIAGSSRSSNNVPRLVSGGRFRGSPSTSGPAQSFSSSHDLDSQKTSLTPGGASIGRSPTATASNASSSSSRTSESCAAATTSTSARNGVGDGENTRSRFRQQNNRNVTSAVTLENTCTTNIGGTGNAELSSPSICVSLSPPIIAATTTTTASGKASLSVANSAETVVNKARRPAGSSSAKRSKTTNINNNIVPTPIPASVSPSAGIGEATKLGNGMANSGNTASNTITAAAITSSLSSDEQQNDSNQHGSSILSQRQQASSTSKTTPSLPRPSTLFKPKDVASPGASNSPLGTEHPVSDDSANASDAGLKMKIKRKKMATRQTAASHEVISGKERKRENSDEASSSSSSSSACASPAPNMVINRNSPMPTIGNEKKRKSSTSSGSALRAAVIAAGAPSSPASSISSTSSTSASSVYNHHQQQQHSSSSSSVLSLASAVSTPSSPPSVNVNRASPFTNTGASMVTVSPTVGSPALNHGLGFQMAASDSISNCANVTGSATARDKGHAKSTKNLQQETSGMSTPPRKKSKIQADHQVKTPNLGFHQSEGADQAQEAKISISSHSATVFTPVLDAPKEKVEQHDAGTWVRTIGTSTETECLGPCEPGTSVTLEGIVWQETSGGILVINVTWRGKTYVGTLLDCTKYDWAPPRHCDSPHSENDSVAGSSNVNSASGNRTPAKSGNGNGNGRGRKGGSKRQQQQQQMQQQSTSTPQSETAAAVASSSGSTDQDTNGNGNEEKASTSGSQNGCSSGKDSKTAVSEAILEPHSPIMFECPLGSCEKKFAAVVGVKYHQSSAHRHSYGTAIKEHHGLCPHTKKGADAAKEDTMSPTEEAVRSLEEAVAESTTLSPEERASLESLFKVAEQSRQQEKQQASGKESTRAGSPAYSDISEDEGLPPTLTEHQPASTATAAVSHSGHGVEKPTAIVEPQPLASAIVAIAADIPTCASPRQATAQMDCSSSSSALHHSPRGKKRSHSSTPKPPKDSKHGAERQPASAVVEPNMVRMTPPTASSSVSVSPAISRSPDVCQVSKSQSSVLIKAEPGSPRPSVQEFVAPAPPPPPPILQQQLSTGLISLPAHQAVQSQPSTPVAARIPTPSSHLSAPSPATMVQASPVMSHPPTTVPQMSAPPSHHHLNMMNQLSHPAFMFNPFNPNAMFPGGSVPQGMMPPSMAMDPAMAAAAALMAAGHPAAAMYASPGSMAAAALAAAGFQMGLGGPPPGSHPSVGYGFGPPPHSLAVSMASGVLPPSFGPVPNVGPLPPPGQPMQQPPSSPVASLHQHQQQLHKIHELTEHAKRATPADPATPTPSVLLPPSSGVLNGVGSGGSGSQKSSSTSSGSTPTGSSESGSGKHRSSLPTSKVASSGSSSATSSGSHASGGSGQHGHHKTSSGSGNGAENASHQNRQHSRTPTSASTPVASSDLKASSLGPSVSPPVQRHLHTHHHTHTYPTLLAPAIDPSYAAIVASQQAAAAAAGVVGCGGSGFPPFGAPPKS